MAKSKSFFGLRKGSTRDHTFYIQDGKQITRSRVEHVKNPRSRAQMIQRMVMTTAIAAYKCLKEICDHSWEGVEYGAKSFQRFMTMNTKILHAEVSKERTNFSFNRWHDNKSCSGEFQISDGTLNNYKGVRFEFQLLDTTPVGLDFVWAFINDWQAELTNATILTNTGLSVGDTMAFCFLVSLKEQEANVYWLRMTILDDSDIILMPDVIEQHIKIESNSNYELETDERHGVITVHLLTPTTTKAKNIYSAMILSHKDGNVWQRTPATLTSNVTESGLTSAADALATYPTAHNFILNGN